jgi:hypothetical protein
VHGVSAHGIVVHACSIDELGVEFPGEQRVGKLAEKLLQQAGNAIDIVLESFRVAKIDLRGVCDGLARRQTTGYHRNIPLSNKAFICWM